MFGVRNVSMLFQKQIIKSFSTFKVISSQISISPKRFSVISHVSKDTPSSTTTTTTSISYRFLTHSAVYCTSNDKKSPSTSDQTRNIGEYDTLTEYHAYDMIFKLSDNDRKALSNALNKYDSEKFKSKLQGKL